MTSTSEETTQQTPAPKLEISTSRQFTSWLNDVEASLAFTTYQTGKLFFIGLQESGKLSVFERTFNRCVARSKIYPAEKAWLV